MGKKDLLFAAVFLVTSIFSMALVPQAWAYTDPSDALGLEDLYGRESWTGVSCDGKLPGLNIKGYLGRLYFLENLKHLDVSSNNIVGEIPFGFPPCATDHIKLPYLGTRLHFLENLNHSDLSYNFSGDLSSSFVHLTNLTGLFMENNHFTGSVDLTLIDLNIQSNHFSGVIPTQFIQKLWIGGNRFYIVDSYPPCESSAIENYPSLKLPGRHEKRNLAPGGIACVVGGIILRMTFVAVCIKRSEVFSARASCHSLPVKSMLTILLLVSQLPAAASIPKAKNVPLKPNNYELCLQWGRNLQPDARTRFTLQGLWGKRGKERVKNEAVGAIHFHKAEALSFTEKDLEKIWPSFATANEKLWNHEWEVHGSLFFNTPREYFLKGVELFQHFKRIHKTFMEGGIRIRRSYQPLQFTSVFQRHYGITPKMVFKRNRLCEIRICLDEHFNVVDCDMEHKFINAKRGEGGFYALA